jgi:hypothetical protein
LPVFLLLAVVYSSINTCFLPHGVSFLLLTGLATIPLSLIQTRGLVRNLFFYLLLLLLIQYFFFQVNVSFFLKSSLLFLGFISLFQWLDSFLRRPGKAEILLRFLVRVNAVLLVLYLILWFTPGREMVWWTFFLSSSVGEFTRLKGLGYEPSYMALMLAPVFLFQLSRLLNGMHSKSEIALLFFLLLGLIFSFSFGVLGCLMITLASLTFIFCIQKTLFSKPENRFCWLLRRVFRSFPSSSC